LLGRLLNRGTHRATKSEPGDVERLAAAGAALQERAGPRPEVVKPDYDTLPDGEGIPEVSAEQLTPGLIRGSILRHGAVIARGLVDPEPATQLTGEIDRAIAASQASGRRGKNGSFRPLAVEELAPSRSVTMSTGTLLLADCPQVAFELISLYRDAGVRELIEGYLNEPPALSADKTTLRKAMPSPEPGGWHQDGKFLGDVNSLNLWLSLSHCGDTAPGLDLVPRRLDEIVEAGVGPDGLAAITVPHERAEELAGDLGIARPIFEPGDGIFFDHMNLHRTASEPQMTGTRYAVESWFFGPSAFPEGYTALAF